jgi:hypothetical protein
MEPVLDHEQDLKWPVADPARAEDLLAACYQDMRRVAERRATSPARFL